MEKKLEELTVTEIKALLYDQIVLMEQTKNNINILQKELVNPKRISEQCKPEQGE